MKKSILIIISIIFVATSCQKTLNIEVEDKEKKIVINGILYPDSIVKVNISRGLGVLEEDTGNSQFLNKATAKLYENNNYIETLVFDSIGFYHSTIIPDVSKNYKLEVESDGLEKAVGTAEFIKSVPFTISDMEYFIVDSTVTITTTSRQNWDEIFEPFDTTYQDVVFNCKLNIEDPASEQNFYIIEAYSYNFSTGYSYSSFEDAEGNVYEEEGIYMKESEFNNLYAYYYIENNNNLIENSTFYGNRVSILQDELFNGQTLNLNLDIYFTTFDLQPIYIKIYSIPKDYINYVKSEDKYYQANGNPFAQPVNVFSNIENGFGIFTAFGLHEQVINLY